MYIAIM